MNRRRGMTLVEVLVGSALGALLMGPVIGMMIGLGQAEVRTDAASSAVEQGARAYEYLLRDLGRLAQLESEPAVEVLSDGGADGEAELLVRTVPELPGEPVQVIHYYLEPVTRVLKRSVLGDSETRFELGNEGGLRLELVGDDDGSLPSQLLFWVTVADSDLPPGAELITSGVAPLSLEQSRELFPYWNGS